MSRRKQALAPFKKNNTIFLIICVQEYTYIYCVINHNKYTKYPLPHPDEIYLASPQGQGHHNSTWLPNYCGSVLPTVTNTANVPCRRKPENQ